MRGLTGEVAELRAAALTAAKERSALQQILESKVRVMLADIIQQVRGAETMVWASSCCILGLYSVLACRSSVQVLGRGSRQVSWHTVCVHISVITRSIALMLLHAGVGSTCPRGGQRWRRRSLPAAAAGAAGGAGAVGGARGGGHWQQRRHVTGGSKCHGMSGDTPLRLYVSPEQCPLSVQYTAMLSKAFERSRAALKCCKCLKREAGGALKHVCMCWDCV